MTTIAVVHVNDIFSSELKSRCDRFRDELNYLVSVKNLGTFKGSEVVTTCGTGRRILCRYSTKRLPMS